MKKKKLSNLQVIALGYFIIIILGAGLLSLPISSATGEWTNFLTALFTATSSGCVTGLVVENTATYWSLFGQTVIICLIQIGGLGFMTIATFFFRMLRKTGLRERMIMADSINTTRMNDMGKFIRRIVIGTVIIEAIGGIILSLRFVGDFGALKGIYMGFFHSISAFCNAGFDIVSVNTPYASFTEYSSDITVNIVIMLLIIIGGIGFIVWDDIITHRTKFKHYSLHSKIVIAITTILIFGGAILFLIFEYDSLSDNSLKDKILISLFNSVTPRTAGFNTVDTAALSDSSKLLTMLFMLIGGSPGSTAGGIKTTTIAVIIIYIICSNRGEEAPHIFGRKISDEAIKKALIIFAVNLLLAFFGAVLICAVQNLPLDDILFETFSAIGTVGMSTGITRDLNAFSQVVVMFLMYCGRVGSVSFALAVFQKKIKIPVSYPDGQVTIG